MELSRPHYSVTWPPVLLAAALWLHAGGLNTPRDPSLDTTRSDAAVNDAPVDRFHLLFGKS